MQVRGLAKALLTPLGKFVFVLCCHRLDDAEAYRWGLEREAESLLSCSRCVGQWVRTTPNW